MIQRQRVRGDTKRPLTRQVAPTRLRPLAWRERLSVLDVRRKPSVSIIHHNRQPYSTLPPPPVLIATFLFTPHSFPTTATDTCNPANKAEDRQAFVKTPTPNSSVSAFWPREATKSETVATTQVQSNLCTESQGFLLGALPFSSCCSATLRVGDGTGWTVTIECGPPDIHFSDLIKPLSVYLYCQLHTQRPNTVKIQGHEARASLLGGQPLDRSYQQYAGGFHREGYKPRPAGRGQARGIMYKPNSFWTWAFVAVTTLQAAIVMAFEA